MSFFPQQQGENLMGEDILDDLLLKTGDAFELKKEHPIKKRKLRVKMAVDPSHSREDDS